MSKRTIALAVLAAATTAISNAPAKAGCCCARTCAPAAPMMVYQPYEMPQVYVVDQGPVYSGPGIYTNPTVVVPRMPDYPYVGGYPQGGSYEADQYLPPYEEPLRSRAQATLPRRAIKRWQQGHR
jgi:hypothetical protein